MLKKGSKLFSQSNFFKWLLIGAGTIAWSLTMIKSGVVYDYGMGFWGPNGHDGVWHIAITEGLIRGSSEMPVFSGELLKNYHLGFDLFLAFLNRITAIPVVNLYFQIIPPVFAFLIGWLVYKFVKTWQKSEKKAFWSTFFIYFGGSFGWLVTLFREGKLGGESMFWSQQGISSLINPPFAMSLVVILLGLISTLKYLEDKKTLHLALSVLLFGILVQIKVYAGLLILGGLFTTWAYYGLRKVRSSDPVHWVVGVRNVFFGSLALSLVLFYPNIKNGASLIVFQPFWFLENMMALSDRLGWQRFHSAMTNYRLGGEWIKAVLAYIAAFVIFYYGNVGTRLIAEFGIVKWISEKKLDWVKIFFIPIILAGVIIPTFFLQKGTPWNTIQFFYYSLFFLGILAGVAFVEILERARSSAVLIYSVIAVVVFTAPTTLGTFKHYLPSRPPSKISSEELEALSFLSTQKDGVVLTFPFERNSATSVTTEPPKPLYIYESTSYVSAFGKKQVFLEDEVNLDITGYDWKTRKEEVLGFYSTLDEKVAHSFLRDNDIDYVYWIKGQRAKNGEGQLEISNIFENDEVTIYRVD